MATKGPFHSLSQADKTQLITLIAGGASVRQAAAELEVHYSHALNYAHTQNLVTARRPIPSSVISTAVDLVAQGASLSDAAREVDINITAVFHAATAAGAHQPKKIPRGAGATTRRVEYLLLRVSAMTRKDAAAASGIGLRTAEDYDRV